MAQQYDLNDPTDLDIMRAYYDSMSEEEWQTLLDFSQLPENKRAFTFEERGCLIRMAKKAGQYHRPADKDIRWGLSLVDKIDLLMNQVSANKDAEAAIEKHTNGKAKHITLRVAWHDNKWDGSICKDPLRNHYCSGFNSLLSERLRKRKEKNLEQELAFKGQPVKDEYIPPCFWSINLFGKHNLAVSHDNPADPDLALINEELPAESVFSWPFAVSFTRTKEQIKADGAYPRNLETVRIPKFNNSVHKGQSVAFMYTKFSNPLTEEDQQYLVIGCGLVTDKGKYHYFGPKELIDKKKSSKPKYRNFPSMNWAIRYSFQEPNLLVRMPYHEYLDYVDQPGFDAEGKEQLLNKIKVAITEPELNHCFKYVAMDVDDDEAIFILTKMRKHLIDCKDDGIVQPIEMQDRIDAVEQLLSFCWKKRSYFPGFASICRSILNWDKQEFLLDELIEELQQNEQDDYFNSFLSLIENPKGKSCYRKYASLIQDVKEVLEDNYGLTEEQFLNLCMLNLKPFQYKRILAGKLKLSADWKKTIEDERASHLLADICANPYLLYEDYQAYDALLDQVTGEEVDSPIDLFKVDVAYFPDTRFGLERIDLQRQMRNNDKRRLRALTIRYLRTLENTGHCFADAEELENAIKAYPLFYNMDTEYQIPAHFFHNLKADYIIHFEENEDKVKVISENDTKYFYLFEVYKAEGEIEKVIHQLIQNESLSTIYPHLDDYINSSCKYLRGKLATAFEEDLFKSERQQLYNNIYSNRLFVLTGNAGSGKSYEMLNIITEWKKRGEKYLLLAPTGKAALRLKTDQDFKGIEAFTIDKILADIRNKKMTIPTLQSFNNIIIDEMSMVDLLKLRDFLRLINVEVPSFKRLILVGDPHQLPAIGYGKVLKDILYFLRTNPEHNNKCIELQVNCRHELAESRILDFAEGYVADGEMDADLISILSSAKSDISKGFRMHFWNTEDELFKLLNREFDLLCSNREIPLAGNSTEKLNQIFGLEKTGEISSSQSYNLENFQLITPYRSDFFGSVQINDYVQREYKSKLELKYINNWFKQSDKIIRTKNYYEKGKLILSNGSIGLIRHESETLLHFPELDEPMPIYGEDGIRKSELEEFDLAYAITVHKAQGSGFNHCFFILPKKPGLLSKELIYTALTRSRESMTLFVQGNKDEPFEKSVLEKGRSRSYTESRRTTLLLDKPYRYYALEIDGIFIESRVELLIYQALKQVQKELGENELRFQYEIRPTVGDTQLPMKTDFTLVTKKGIWYWEHLGRLGNKKYEWTWHNVKKKTYNEFGLMESLITTDELNGINPDKIKEIVNLIVHNLVKSEDLMNRYSLHHYSLR